MSSVQGGSSPVAPGIVCTPTHEGPGDSQELSPPATDTRKVQRYENPRRRLNFPDALSGACERRNPRL